MEQTQNFQTTPALFWMDYAHSLEFLLEAWCKLVVTSDSLLDNLDRSFYANLLSNLDNYDCSDIHTVFANLLGASLMEHKTRGRCAVMLLYSSTGRIHYDNLKSFLSIEVRLNAGALLRILSVIRRQKDWLQYYRPMFTDELLESIRLMDEEVMEIPEARHEYFSRNPSEAPQRSSEGVWVPKRTIRAREHDMLGFWGAIGPHIPCDSPGYYKGPQDLIRFIRDGAPAKMIIKCLLDGADTETPYCTKPYNYPSGHLVALPTGHKPLFPLDIYMYQDKKLQSPYLLLWHCIYTKQYEYARLLYEAGANMKECRKWYERLDEFPGFHAIEDAPRSPGEKGDGVQNRRQMFNFFRTICEEVRPLSQLVIVYLRRKKLLLRLGKYVLRHLRAESQT